MKDLDVNKIYSIFNKDDKKIFEETPEKITSKDSLEYFNIFCRGLINFSSLDELHINKFGEKYEEIRSKIRGKVYRKLYKSLEKVDLSNESIIENTVTDLNEYPVYTLIEDVMEYFIDIEEYEKCTLLKDTLDIVKSYR